MFDLSTIRYTFQGHGVEKLVCIVPELSLEPEEPIVCFYMPSGFAIHTTSRLDSLLMTCLQSLQRLLLGSYTSQS